VHGGIDPSPSLGEQNFESVRHHGLAKGLRDKDCPPRWKILQHQRREKPKVQTKKKKMRKKKKRS
jgi:hypothetical protein